MTPEDQEMHPTDVEEPDGETTANAEIDADRAAPALTVVGIGASAGGLEALSALFTALPADSGLTFVVVVHLSPDHESVLAHLLQAATAMPVIQVTERVQMLPDHVYVIPPGKGLLVSDHALDLEELEPSRGPRIQIDLFFRSLAEVRGDGAAIILSGTGSDGSLGIQAIKEHGGLILVQSPDEAEYESMPRNALATGLVDVVGPVKELARQLVAAKQTKASYQLTETEEVFSEANQHTFVQLLAFVQLHTGHDFRGYKQTTLLRRIGRRLQLTQQRSLSGYLHYLRQNEGEVELLFRDLLINVTNFFRDPEAWAALAESVIPQILSHKTNTDNIRVWSVGCATGEEAYSLAILLLEAAERQGFGGEIQIFASDLSKTALDYARQGKYPAAIAADVSEERLARFFVKDDSHYRVRASVRERVLFSQHNLLQDPPFSKLDLIVCRNVLIYLQRHLQEKVFDSLHYALLPHGYLFLGNAEAIEGVADFFEAVNKRLRIYQRLTLVGLTRILPSFPVRAHTQPLLPHVQEGALKQATPETIHRFLLEELGPPSLLVNSLYQILHFSEAVGRYLFTRGGTPTIEVLRLVRPELQAVLHAALYQALEKGLAARTEPVAVRFNGSSHFVSMLVQPGTQGYALVVFLEEPGAIELGHQDGDEFTDRNASQQLEAELHYSQLLQTTRTEYDTIVEELRTANEELQSTNEEYKSTLEEFETSKEELQSVNEELQTINQELKNKVEEVTQANNDLQNLFAATHIATLFLDRELKVRRFTPEAAELFNLLPSDRDRPITHLRPLIDYEQLESDARQVLANLSSLTREASTPAGRWYLVELRPYRTVDERIDGVVITFVDITENKQTERALLVAKEYAESIIYTTTNPLVVLGTDLRVRTANRAFYKTFQVLEEDTEGQAIYELGNGQWNIPSLRRLLEEILPNDQSFEDYEVTHVFETIGYRTMLLNGRRLDDVQLILLAIDDITERKAAEEVIRHLNTSLESQVEERTQQVRNLITQLTMGEQEERRRISGILHDDLQQRLFSLNFQLVTLRTLLQERDWEGAQQIISESEEEIKESVEMTRDLSVNLSPPVLHNEGLVEAFRWLASQMKERQGLAVLIEPADNFPPLDDDLRELLFNIIKHAGVKSATIALTYGDDHLRIEVEDRGRGFDAATERLSTSQGLLRIEQRLRLLGGRMQIESTPGQGTRVIITCPLRAQAKEE